MNWIAKMKKDGKNWVAYAEALERRLKMASDALSVLSRGSYYIGDKVKSNDLSEQMKSTAAATLARMAVTGPTEKPSAWYF